MFIASHKKLEKIFKYYLKYRVNNLSSVFWHFEV